MLRIIKDYVLRTSRSLGYDIVPLRETHERDLAIHLSELFDRLAIDCVLDVGANIGQYRDFLRSKVFYDGLIVSFEPVAQNAAQLRHRSLSDKHWIVESYALGRDDRPLTINVMKSDQFSSFLEPDNSRVPGFTGLNEAARVEEVEMRTLDGVFPALQRQHGFNNVYLKIDTQGYDMTVLQGAPETLGKVSALQTEASVIGIYKDMPNYIDTIHFLNESGFDVTGMYPISRDPALRLIEFDCVMINRKYARLPI